jgi:hypothetical protein
MITRLVGFDVTRRIGAPVQVTFRRVGARRLPVFRPADTCHADFE